MAVHESQKTHAGKKDGEDEVDLSDEDLRVGKLIARRKIQKTVHKYIKEATNTFSPAYWKERLSRWGDPACEEHNMVSLFEENGKSMGDAGKFVILRWFLNGFYTQRRFQHRFKPCRFCDRISELQLTVPYIKRKFYNCDFGEDSLEHFRECIAITLVLKHLHFLDCTTVPWYQQAYIGSTDFGAWKRNVEGEWTRTTSAVTLARTICAIYDLHNTMRNNDMYWDTVHSGAAAFRDVLKTNGWRDARARRQKRHRKKQKNGGRPNNGCTENAWDEALAITYEIT